MSDEFVVIRRERSARARGDRKFEARARSASDQISSVTRHAEKRVEVLSLSASDRHDLARDDTVEAMARTMPLRLISPVSKQTVQGGKAWAFEALGIDEEVDGGSGVSIAILDTGIDVKHAAFKGLKFGEKNNVDFTGEGKGDKDGHGTHCAGTIFGRDVEGVRIGVAREVTRVFVGKVIGENGGSSSALFRALDAALDYGSNVISMSLGFDFPGMVAALVAEGWPIELATSLALESYRDNLEVFNAVQGKIAAFGRLGRGTLVVAATGNESRVDDNPHYRLGPSLPAAASGVLRVGALERTHGEKFSVAAFSNGGASLCAPGVDILSARAGGGLTMMSGTSMATPYVAGVAALWIERVSSGDAPRDLIGSVLHQMMASADQSRIAGDSALVFGEGIVRPPHLPR